MATVYKVTTLGNIENQDCLNSFYYVGTGTDISTDLLGDIFYFVLLETIRTALSSTFKYVEMLIEDLLSPSENIIVDLSAKDGLRPAEHISAFYTYSFQLKPALAGYRSGRKAFSGVADIDVEFGQPNGTQLARLQNIATSLESVYEVVGLDAEFFPIIYNTTLTGGKIANPLSNALWKRLSTQNSRKTYTSGQASLGVTGYGTRYTPAGTNPNTYNIYTGEQAKSDWERRFGQYLPLAIPPTVDNLPIPLP